MLIGFISCMKVLAVSIVDCGRLSIGCDRLYVNVKRCHISVNMFYV